MSAPGGTKGARSRRFEGGLSPVAQAMNASVAFDRRLLPHDVAGSQAHARMLAARGIIADADAEAIRTGLDRVQARLAAGELPWDPALEDVHMNVEARLIDDIGDAGRRLHTGRSRNDQVALDLRLYARHQAAGLAGRVRTLRRALVEQARRHVDTLMPGYTHLQRAQPVRAAHHFLAYDAMLARDGGRLRDAAARMGESPLGAGALAGTTLPIDREAVAAALGFAGVTRNSLDTVGDRDFALDWTWAGARVQLALSRLATDVIDFTTSEFAFLKIGDAVAAGSRM
ncbi:MAG TPA: argininosuccinate lyase, partial [Kofleriaceae bacterium]|nr:argininosuccinate lyase [Kofleriaceae bacterium]